ncbi:MAG: amidohydrolase [Pseudomonadales bacterium]
MSDLAVSLVQTQLEWEHARANREHLQDLLAPLAKSSLAVLPEMFSSGFSNRSAAIAEAADGESVQWAIEQAQILRGAIAGSLAIQLENGVANRFIFATEDPTVKHYDKRHLFRMAGEHKRYIAGLQRQIFNWRGWRILPQVCYDLRFPVWSRNRNDYDLAIYVANWPAARRYAWRQLLIARAIENQCYVIGVNRVGIDGNEIDYSGDSLVIGPDGNIVLDMKDYNGTETCSLSLNRLQEYREKFPAWMDADGFNITLEP